MHKKLLILLFFGISAGSYAQGFQCGDTLIDIRDGQKYATVLIGSDCWFKQNLNYGTFIQSDSLGVIHSQQTDNGIPEKYAQGNDANNLAIYGGLYEQGELMNYNTAPQGLCPDGWHVSTDAEWQQLITEAGGTMISASEGSGGIGLKAVGTGFGWASGTDVVGISLLPGGDRDGFGIFYGLDFRYIYWTSTMASVNQAYHYTLWADNDTIQRLTLGVQSTGFSCRCVKDAGNGIDELDTSEIKLYPNPSNNTIHLETSVGAAAYRITDITGKVVMHASFENQITQQEIAIESLPWGTYFIHVKTDSGNWLQPEKFVKQTK